MIELPSVMRIVSKIWQEIESILLVSLFTVLIWLYAEGENVKARELTFSLQLIPPPGVPMLIEPGAAQTVQVKFNAATNQYEQLRQLSLMPVKVQVHEGEGGRETDLSLRDAIAGLDQFKKFGLSPTDVQPRTIRVVAERLERREGFDVVVDEKTSNVTAQPGTLALSPAKVSIMMPVSDWAEWDKRKEQPRLVLTAPDLDRLSENQETRLEGKVVVPGDLRGPVTVTPGSVLASFRVHKNTATTTIDSVRVMVKAPPLGPDPDTVPQVIIADQFRFIRGVKLSGTSDAISRIDSKQTAVEAVLALDDADMTKAGPASRQVTLIVPPGVTVTSPSTPPTIEYSIILGRKPLGPP